MEALAAIGLASNILQFVDFSTKAIRGGLEIHDSLTGMTADNASLESTTVKMKELSSKLLPQTGRETSEDEKALARVAAECNILSDQILGLLEKLKPKNSKSRRQIAKATIVNLCSEREKLELEKRLDSCRSQLQLQLSHLLSSEAKVQLIELITQSEGNADMLKTLESGVKQLQQGVQIASLSDEAQSQMQKLLALPEEAYRRIAQQRILEALAFGDMHGRFESVCEAHYETFEWIFHDATKSARQNSENQSEMADSSSSADIELNGDSNTGPIKAHPDIANRNRASKCFTQWLATGDDIFHVSGKLGSGKSTLMKFLCDHPQTQEELQKWAGIRKLVFAQFFFWKPGSKLQKSLIGLVRSLLHDTLQHHPELIPKVFEERWNSVLLAPWQVHTRFEISNKEIKAAFSRLIESQNTYKSHCFCYFIDGLDEYEETIEDDYKSLVNLLCKWTENSPKNVKLCVSSRENNVFLSAFSEEKRIRLQDLTMGDMKNYIRNKLEIAISSENESFVLRVAQKGSGIFLWVALVVKSLRTRLEDGHELHSLECELESLPEELEGLFDLLLKTLPKSDRRNAYQLFAMVLEWQNTPGLYLRNQILSPLAYSFLSDVTSNAEFAQSKNFPYSAMASEEIHHRTHKARKNINGYCRGLLEVGDFIEFTHRSVPEYFGRPKIRDEMSTHLESFNVVNTISQLLLAEIKSKTCQTKYDLQRVASLSSTIVQLRVKHTSDKPPFSFLECLATSLLLHYSGRKDEQGRHWGWAPSLHRVWFPFISGARITRDDTRFTTDDTRYRHTLGPLHLSAAEGSWEYLEWKLQNDPEIIDSDYKIGVLLWHVYKRLERSAAVQPSSFNPFTYLLSLGISTEAKLHTSDATSRYEHSPGLSFWEHFLFHLSAHFWVRRNKHNRQFYSDSMSAFLQYDADPEISFHLRRMPNHEGEIQLERNVSKSIKSVRIYSGGWGKCIIGQFSLRDLIKSLKSENEESLLQLLDKKIKEREHKRGMQIQAAKSDQTVQMDQEDNGNKQIIQEDPIATFPLQVRSVQGQEAFHSGSKNSKNKEHGCRDNMKQCEGERSETEEETITDESMEVSTTKKQDTKANMSEELDAVEAPCETQNFAVNQVSSTQQKTLFDPTSVRKSLSNPVFTFILGLIIAVLVLRLLQ